MKIIKRERPVLYFIQKNGAQNRMTPERKQQLVKQGYQIIVFVEGEEDMRKGLQDVVGNHVC